MAKRLLLMSLLWLNGHGVWADEIVVIMNRQTPAPPLTKSHLADIFLRKSWLGADGGRWIPLNLRPDHPLRLAFSLSLFGLSPAALEQYWNEQYFQGITPPYVVASEEAMLRFVATTPGAIGYILPCHADNRVQVVFRLPTTLASKTVCHDD